MNVRRTRRGARRAAAVALTAALVAAGPAATATASTAPLWWWDAYDIAALHEQGWTGEGVTIAVMDERINPDLPVFEGRSLTVAEGALCEEGDEPVSSEATRGSEHGSAVTALLIGNGAGAGGVQGIAPDADVIFYGTGRADHSSGDCTAREDPEVLSHFGLGLKRAIDDGADIFTTSVGEPWESEDGDGAVIAEAIAKGVVIVNATSNPGSGLAQRSLGMINGVIAAAAVDSSGMLQTDADGQPFVREETHVVAAGVDIPTVGVAGVGWDESRTGSGSSYAAPLVAGMLALAAERYPEASANQLVQALLHTTNGSIHEPMYEPETGYGYGAAWPASLLQSDPTSYPDEHPLMDRPYGIPSAEQVAEAVARESGPAPSEGATPAPAEEAGVTPPDSSDPLATVMVAALAALVVAIVGGVIIAVIIAARRKRLPQGETP